MISKSLSTSQKFARLLEHGGELGEFCQSLYPLLVAHTDDFGRLQGDAFSVKHLCHPASPRTLEDFDRALNIFDAVGLVKRYTVEEVTAIQIIGFDLHQSGIHKRTASRFPEPPGNSGKFREIPSELNLTELNRRERENSPYLSPAAPHDPFNDEKTTDRAGRFLERYQELYPEHRHGARYALKPARDYAAAVTLCHTWDDDERLEKLAVLFLTTDHKFAEEGSRTVPQFLALASWCDGKLAEWESGRRAS